LPSQPEFWSVEDRLQALSAQGAPLEKLLEIVDFELFRPALDKAVGASDRAKDGRPPLSFRYRNLLHQVVATNA